MKGPGLLLLLGALAAQLEEAPETRSISVQIVDTDGSPIGGAELVALSGAPSFIPALRADQGPVDLRLERGGVLELSVVSPPGLLDTARLVVRDARGNEILPLLQAELTAFGDLVHDLSEPGQVILHHAPAGQLTLRLESGVGSVVHEVEVRTGETTRLSLELDGSGR